MGLCLWEGYLKLIDMGSPKQLWVAPFPRVPGEGGGPELCKSGEIQLSTSERAFMHLFALSYRSEA